MGMRGQSIKRGRGANDIGGVDVRSRGVEEAAKKIVIE